MVYDPQALSLRLTLPDTLRAARSVQLGSMSAEPAGTFDQPADVSAYVNARLSWDHVARGPDTGFADPLIFLDGAARIGGDRKSTSMNSSPHAHPVCRFQLVQKNTINTYITTLITL